jgi:hypothetical protein
MTERVIIEDSDGDKLTFPTTVTEPYGLLVGLVDVDKGWLGGVYLQEEGAKTIISTLQGAFKL